MGKKVKPSSGLNGQAKKSRGASAPNSDTETVSTYGVVASEYNIQAQINWLTAPPTTTNDKKMASLPNQMIPSKKPQRGYHKDVCEACGEGECLMYCDKCPVAFHAICDDPPLPPEDFEEIGVNWKCKKCRNSVTVKEEEPSEDSSSGLGVIGQVFQQSIQQFHTQYPAQFKLTKEMPAYDYPFPGTSRHLVKKSRQRTTVIEVENGIVPRPIALCYHCQKSCRTGPLIQCDKCDLFFHLDCLDPPLTTIPTSVWICPLHIEPYLESTQLTSVALSERIKIWESGDKPVQRQAVILNFLRKCSRKNPMFRRKQPIRMVRMHDEVPEMVRKNYEDLPLLQERFGGLQTLAAVAEMEKAQLDMQEQVEAHRAACQELYPPMEEILTDQTSKLDSLRTRNEIKVEILNEMISLMNADLKKPDAEGVVPAAEVKEEPAEDENWLQKEMKTMFKDVECDKKRALDILRDMKEVGMKLEDVADAISSGKDKQTEKKEGLKTGTGSFQDAMVQTKRLPKRTIRRLAAHHLRYLRRKKAIRQSQKAYNMENRFLTSYTKSPKFLLSLLVENNGMTVEMTQSNFWLGSGDACDLKITDFVCCNRVEGKHARIFYNPAEGCWEILNYSPNGIYVNNIMFGFKSSELVDTNISERYQEMHERSLSRIDEYIQANYTDLFADDLKPCHCKPFPVRAKTDVFEGSAKLLTGHRVQIGCIRLLVQGTLTHER